MKVHRKVLAEYKKFGMQVPPLPTANEESIRIFYEKARTSGRPITREINMVSRIKESGKEYFVYHQELRSHDSLGNEIEVYMPHVGKYKKPHFDFITDPHTEARIPTSIKSEETIYELEWPKDWIPELENDLINGIDNLLVIAGSRHYGGYTWDQFKEHSFDELVMIGKYGVVNPSPQIIQVADQRKAEADKKRTK